jgi:hypothetical protein
MDQGCLDSLGNCRWKVQIIPNQGGQLEPACTERSSLRQKLTLSLRCLCCDEMAQVFSDQFWISFWSVIIYNVATIVEYGKIHLQKTSGIIDYLDLGGQYEEHAGWL